MASVNENPGLPQTMRAWTYHQRGAPSSVLALSEVPLPQISSPNDVLIKVSYGSLNPAGSVLISVVPAFVRKSPSIPELDFSGTVVKVGAAVRSDIKPGVHVFGSVPPLYNLRRGIGALAEYVVVPVTNIAIKPKTVEFEAAAGLGITGITALGLAKDAGLKEGDSVLINGASGGVGTMIVQIARKAVGENGKVVAICSAENAELVKSLGADEVSKLNDRTSLFKRYWF
jgi:NADPH:quinone reductase-like Zn-dependent oxidoreductase